MFFIVNKTKKHITLPDIKISLGPRQALDLDKIMDRSESEKSRHLRAATHKGDVEIRTKDGEARKRIPNTPTKPEGPDISKIKDEIIKEMKDEIKSLKSDKEPSNNLSKEDLIEVMKEMMNSMPSREVVVREGSEQKLEEEEVEVDENLMGEINKRAINKMVENTESVEIKYKKEKKKDDLEDNINELEDLLG